MFDLLTKNGQQPNGNHQDASEGGADFVSLSQSFLTTLSSKSIRSCVEFQQALKTANQELSQLIENSAIQASDGHIVFKFSLSKFDQAKQTESGQFVIADLSSSDKLRKSVFLGNKMMETIEKNSSLVSFSKAISYLLENRRELINPSECTLVEVLYQALGGNSITCYIVSVSLDEHDRERTLNTLLFAQNISHLENIVTFTAEQNASTSQTRKSAVQNKADNNRRSILPHGMREKETESRKHIRFDPEMNEPQTPLGSTWMDKCNLLLGTSNGEIEQLKKQNTELQTQVKELQKFVQFSNLDQSAVSKDSPVKNMSFFSADHDQSLPSILRMAEQQLLYQSTSPATKSQALKGKRLESERHGQVHDHLEQSQERDSAKFRDMLENEKRKYEDLISQLREERAAFETELQRSTS